VSEFRDGIVACLEQKICSAPGGAKPRKGKAHEVEPVAGLPECLELFCQILWHSYLLFESTTIAESRLSSYGPWTSSGTRRIPAADVHGVAIISNHNAEITQLLG
jgi:hypothetical protein